ncbi:MAG: hypothetical protein C4567_11190, partial [Deltaproteobacteria bacterium]
LGQVAVISPKDATPTLTLPPLRGRGLFGRFAPSETAILVNEEFCKRLENKLMIFLTKNLKPKTKNCI